MKPYRILLADDHVMFRHGIRKVLEEERHLEVIGEVSDGLELVEILKILTPNLIILDITMHYLHGLDALSEIKKCYPQIKVLILSMHDNKEVVQQAVASGADGFVLKEQPSKDLLQAINFIRKGHQYFSSGLSKTLMGLVNDKPRKRPLTKREEEILRYLARGLSAKKVSEVLFISFHTVNRHRANIMQKLNLKNYPALIKYAISQGYAD